MENFKPKLPETPITDSLDSENKEYIENRFPLTNDDNLREDYALKTVTDSDFMDKLRVNHEVGEQNTEEIRNTLWNLYESQLKLGNYIDIENDLRKKTEQLIDELRILKTRQDIEKRFKLQKSDISQEEKEKFKEERIEEIKNELFNISSNEILKEDPQKIFEEYSKIIQKYEHLYKMFGDENFDTSLN